MHHILKRIYIILIAVKMLTISKWIKNTKDSLIKIQIYESSIFWSCFHF